MSEVPLYSAGMSAGSRFVHGTLAVMVWLFALFRRMLELSAECHSAKEEKLPGGVLQKRAKNNRERPLFIPTRCHHVRTPTVTHSWLLNL